MLRKIGKQISQYFAVTALRAHDVSQKNPVFERRCHLGRTGRRKIGTKETRPELRISRSSGFILFQNIQRVAMVKLHAHRAQDSTHGARRAALFADHLAYIR